MFRIHDVQFEYETDEGKMIEVDATVRLAPPQHRHPNDPDNDSELLEFKTDPAITNPALRRHLEEQVWDKI